MAVKKSNGLSAEVAGVLSSVVQSNIDMVSEQLRQHVRSLFDDGMRTNDSFEDVLVGVYTAGMQAAFDARPKRNRKSKPEPAASE